MKRKIDKLKNMISLFRQKPQRVYTFYDLKRKDGIFNVWKTITISDNENIDKILKHISTATNHKVYCHENGVTAVCDTKKFGQVIINYQYGYWFFQFGVLKSGVRYDVDYAIARDEHPKLKQWLIDNYGQFEIDYKFDKNL